MPSDRIHGLVVPAPDPQEPTPTVAQYHAAREVTEANTIRISMPVNAPLSRIDDVLDAGLSPLILFGDKGRVLKPVEYGGWAEHVMRHCLTRCQSPLDRRWAGQWEPRWGVEPKNEPAGDVDQQYEPEDLHLLLLTAIDAVKHHGPPGTWTWLPGEIMDCSHGTLKDYGRRMVRLMGALPPKVGWAFHPYRDPRPWWWSRFGRRGGSWIACDLNERRLIEWLAMQRAIGLDVPIIVTEVGWRLCEDVDEQQQRDNLRGEVAFWRTVPTCRGVCVYCAQGPDDSHGIFTPDMTPRAAAKGLFR